MALSDVILLTEIIRATRDIPGVDASSLLTLLKTVDGAGSGLDADLLDGQEGSAFAGAGHSHSLFEDDIYVEGEEIGFGGVYMSRVRLDTGLYGDQTGVDGGGITFEEYLQSSGVFQNLFSIIQKLHVTDRQLQFFYGTSSQPASNTLIALLSYLGKMYIKAAVGVGVAIAELVYTAMFRLTDASGTDRLVVQDSNGKGVFWVDSLGIASSTRANLIKGADLIINADAITITNSFHRVDTEGQAASDNLALINGGNVGDILILSTVSASRDVTIRHNASGGNIRVHGKGDFVLDASVDAVLLFKLSTAFWVAYPLDGG